MTALAHAATFQEPPAFFFQSAGASQTSDALSGMLVTATRHARDNATDWRSLTKALIEQVAVECFSPNWDGYGATPVSLEAKRQAQRLVDLLPFRLAPPEPVPDPDGHISLCWDMGPGHIFTVSVSPSGVLSFAGLLGEGIQRHGVEIFKDSIPKIFVETIDELYQRTNDSNRTRT